MRVRDLILFIEVFFVFKSLLKRAARLSFSQKSRYLTVADFFSSLVLRQIV